MTLDYPAYHWCVLCLAGGVVMMRETCSIVSDSSSGGGGRKAYSLPHQVPAQQAITEEWKKEEAYGD